MNIQNQPAPQPTLKSSRLLLRPFVAADAPAVQKLAGEYAVAEMTLLIPHPYLDGMAEKWIASLSQGWEDRSHMAFAVTSQVDAEFCGAIGLRVDSVHAHGELGYWLGVPFWGRGFATEAVRTMLGFAFGTLGLHRVFAHHFVRNPASGRVLLKAGLRYEGRFREHVQRNNQFEDLECYGILRTDWEPRR